MRKENKFLLSIVAPLVALAAVGAVLTLTSVPDGASTEVQALRVEIAGLREENEDLRNQLSRPIQTSSALASPTQPLPVVGKAADTPRQKSNLPASTQTVSQEEFRAAIEAVKFSTEYRAWRERKSATPDYDLVADLNGQFQGEVLDTNWAYDYEQKLNQLFRSSRIADEFSIRQVACKSQRCQIQVSVKDFDQLNKLYDRMVSALNSGAPGIYPSMVISAVDPATGVGSLYVGKDAGSLRFD